MSIGGRVPIISAALAIAGAAPAGFQPGDLWLISSALPDEAGSQRGAVRIDPATWATTTFLFADPLIHGRAVYDQARDRIVFTSDTGLRTLDSAGVVDAATLGTPTGADDPAATGDGRIYYTVDGPGWIECVDASNTIHDVLAQDGVTQAAILFVEAMWYDKLTNSLITADRSVANVTRIGRSTLNAAGTQVTAFTSVTVDVSASAEIPVGFSAGPGGSVFLKMDDNGSIGVPRMLLVDPATLQVTTYSTSDYFGVGGEIAGAYAPTIDRAVVLDSLNNHLRTFSLGSGGEGMIVLSTGVSGSGSGERAQIIVIPEDPCPSDLSGDGMTDGADLGLLLGAWGTPAGDLNGDGTTDGADLGLLLGAWGDCL